MKTIETTAGVISSGWALNDERSITRCVDADFVRAVALLSRDHQRIHTDPEFAATTIFKRPIAHGVSVVLFVSELLGMYIPAEGTIWQGISMDLILPVYIGDTITTTARIVEINGRKMKVLMTCTNQRGEKVAEGVQSVSYKAPKVS